MLKPAASETPHIAQPIHSLPPPSSSSSSLRPVYADPSQPRDGVSLDTVAPLPRPRTPALTPDYLPVPTLLQQTPQPSTPTATTTDATTATAAASTLTGQ